MKQLGNLPVRIEPYTDDPRNDFSAVLAVLGEINARLDRIESKLAPRQELRPSDSAILAKVLPALGGKFGSSVFTTKEVLSDPVFKELFGSLNRKQVGKLLARSVHRDIGGLCVSRVSMEDNVALWSVVRNLTPS
jgi:hypothetical protein